MKSGSRLEKLALLMGVLGFAGSVAGAFGALALAVAASTLGTPAILSVAVLRHGLAAGWLLHAAAQQGYLVALKRGGPLELPWGTILAPLLLAVALAALAAAAVFERLRDGGKGFGT